MAAWLDQTDFAVNIRDTRLSQMIDGETDILENAVDSAVAVVTDYLCGRYDTVQIFGTSGNLRPHNVIRWVKHLTLWYLYERLPDAITPKKVEKNYDETIEFLKGVSQGDMSVNLPHKPDPNDSTKPLTKFRWGSSARRSL
jgi:phage gp36-like protein